MADVSFDDVEGGFDMGAGPGRLPKMVNLAGAVCSVALIAGLAVWGYKLAVRDVNGIPVMRAMADPMRSAPADPGGEAALHQGLSVNAVAAIGTAAPLPEMLTLAPRPVDLTPDDVAGLVPMPAVGKLAATESGIALQAMATAESGLIDAPLIETADPSDLAPLVAPDAVAAALAEALGTGFSDVVATADIAPATSPRPKQRGDGGTVTAGGAVSAVSAISAVSAGTTVAINQIDPATLAVGTRLVQFGAYDDTTVARSEWLRLVGLFPELMAGKAMVVQEAQSGGRIFYRLRAHGFAGEDDARRFCAALEAESSACVPVAQR